MEKQPTFLKTFSKEHSSDQRKQIADAIRNKRHSHGVEKAGHAAMIEEMRRMLAEESDHYVRQVELVEATGEEIERLCQVPLGKALFYLKLRALRKTHAGESQHADDADARIRSLKEEIFSLDNHTDALVESQKSETQQLLADFYDGELEKWAACGYDKADIDMYFSDEYLKKLSVDEYAKLMQRFPKSMVTHVTRQGVRDHFTSKNHSAGIGSEHNGFKDILETKMLRGKIASVLESENRAEALIKTLRLDDVPYDIAKQRCEVALNRSLFQFLGAKGTYGDYAATHVASEHVLDEYYGGETGNEIFYAFSSLQIVANYSAVGDPLASKDEFINDGRSYYAKSDRFNDFGNDLWVYANNNEGINIDTGVVFIPKHAQVDPRTGSIYEIRHGEGLVENNEYVRASSTVPSEEYWEQYFSQHNCRPSKVVYYEEETPTQAMCNWRARNNISKDLDRDSILNAYGNFRLREDDPDALDRIGHTDFVLWVKPILDAYLEERRIKEGMSN